MRPDSHEDLYDDDEEPTLPRAPSEKSIKASGAHPKFELADSEERDTDVDGRILPADEEPTTAHLPPDVEQVLRGMSAVPADDTVTKPLPRVRTDDRN